MHSKARRRWSTRLSTSLALVLAFSTGVAVVTLAASPAMAAVTTDYSDLGYPNPAAPCRFGDAGGATCANPAEPNGASENDLYDWYVDENGNAMYDSGE